MSTRPRSLEHRYRWLSVAIVGLVALAFGAGLALHLVAPGGRAAGVALHAGLILLMVSPAVRMGVATAERVRKRDVGFLLMMLVVVLELVFVLARA